MLTYVRVQIDPRRHVSHMCTQITTHNHQTLQGGALRGVSAEGLGYILPLLRSIRYVTQDGHFFLVDMHSRERLSRSVGCFSVTPVTIFARKYSVRLITVTLLCQRPSNYTSAHVYGWSWCLATGKNPLSCLRCCERIASFWFVLSART